MNTLRVQQIERAKQLSDDELRNHAEVSIRHRCYCLECFCCAAAEVLAGREQAYAPDSTANRWLARARRHAKA
jgi:hypothetical protein